MHIIQEKQMNEYVDKQRPTCIFLYSVSVNKREVKQNKGSLVYLNDAVDSTGKIWRV
jgi:hypothetical protein